MAERLLTIDPSFGSFWNSVNSCIFWCKTMGFYQWWYLMLKSCEIWKLQWLLGLCISLEKRGDGDFKKSIFFYIFSIKMTVVQLATVSFNKWGGLSLACAFVLHPFSSKDLEYPCFCWTGQWLLDGSGKKRKNLNWKRLKILFLGFYEFLFSFWITLFLCKDCPFKIFVFV